MNVYSTVDIHYTVGDRSKQFEPVLFRRYFFKVKENNVLPISEDTKLKRSYSVQQTSNNPDI